MPSASTSAVPLPDLANLMRRAKRLAREYRSLTGKPLGITGEVAEYEACRLLGLCPTAARQEGFDAIKKTRGCIRRVQVKGRVILPGTKPGQRLGRIDLKHEWDATVLVILDEHFDPVVIYEAERAAIERALAAPGSRARNVRGQLGVSKFRSIARVAWERGGGPQNGRWPRGGTSSGDGISSGT